MNCPDNEHVCSVKKENNLGYYRVHTIWKNDGFFLNVTSKDGAWRGEMTSDDIKEMSGQLQLEPDLYLKECREALTSHDGQPGIAYAVENGSFTWKKVVDEDSGIKIKMGRVMLEPVPFVDTIQNLVNAALNCNKQLLKQMNALSEEKEKMAANRNELLDKLNKLIEEKGLMENDLYSRFILLLNSKKKKIEELENALDDKDRKGFRDESETDKDLQEDPYEVDTDYEGVEDVHVSEGQNTRKRSPKVGECSGGKKAKNDEDILQEDEGSTSMGFGRNKQEIPHTRDEVLEYFYGES